MLTYQINRLLSDEEVISLSCKLIRMNLDCNIVRMGATTIIEVSQ